MPILICNCEHAFQDKRYGRKRRVMNTIKLGKTNEFRCTACGKTRTGDARTLRANNQKNGEDK
jgi:hypothetical protein